MTNYHAETPKHKDNSINIFFYLSKNKEYFLEYSLLRIERLILLQEYSICNIHPKLHIYIVLYLSISEQHFIDHYQWLSHQYRIMFPIIILDIRKQLYSYKVVVFLY